MSPEDIFEKIKLISRNKQRRVPDVAKEIIRALTETVQEGDSVDLIQPIDDLVAWLDENIVFRKK